MKMKRAKGSSSHGRHVVQMIGRQKEKGESDDGAMKNRRGEESDGDERRRREEE